MGSGPIRRFMVVGDSMLPTYSNGDLVFALRSNKARPGQIRVLLHPYNPNVWLVKRVATVRGSDMTVQSDNPAATRADSREFGHVPIAGTFRVVWRLRPPKKRRSQLIE